MTFSGVVGTIASMLGVAFIWPQVVRVYSKQSVEGVSGTSHLIGLTGTLMWLTYGITTDRVPMIVSNLNIEIAIIALMVMLVRKKHCRCGSRCSLSRRPPYSALCSRSSRPR